LKAKIIKVGIKDMQAALDGFVEAGEASLRKGKVKKESGIYFTSVQAFRKALTPKRLELLRIIREQEPPSIHRLARLAKRNIKNVSEDVKFLVQVGLVQMKEAERRRHPKVEYDEISLRIAV